MNEDLNLEYDSLKKQYSELREKIQFVFGSKLSQQVDFYDKLFHTLKNEINKINEVSEKLEKIKSEIPLLEEEKKKILDQISEIDNKLNNIMKSL
ncbi:MAG: hypothetical protein QXR30_04210 [Candidatus Woesearchaeota archaeon]